MTWFTNKELHHAVARIIRSRPVFIPPLNAAKFNKSLGERSQSQCWMRFHAQSRRPNALRELSPRRRRRNPTSYRRSRMCGSVPPERREPPDCTRGNKLRTRSLDEARESGRSVVRAVDGVVGEQDNRWLSSSCSFARINEFVCRNSFIIYKCICIYIYI